MGQKWVEMPQTWEWGGPGGVPVPPHPPGTNWGLVAPQNKTQRPGPEKKRGDLGLPKMEASQPYSGVPPPPGALGPALRLSPGDVVEVTVAEAEQLWWQVGTGPLW
ncbi:VAV protein, partial [Fregetta grallaria]|nr:VAV protein [Fregetta grallaria]